MPSVRVSLFSPAQTSITYDEPMEQIAITGRRSDKPPPYAEFSGSVSALRDFGALIEHTGSRVLLLPQESPSPWPAYLKTIVVRDASELIRYERHDDSFLILGNRSNREKMAGDIRGWVTNKERFGRISPPPHFHFDLATRYISETAGEVIIQIDYGAVE